MQVCDFMYGSFAPHVICELSAVAAVRIVFTIHLEIVYARLADGEELPAQVFSFIQGIIPFIILVIIAFV